MAALLKGIKTLLGDVEMAPYTVIADHQTYEERIYPAKKWICTSVKSTDREASASTMFRLLFNFISGRNIPNIRIDMTTPVTTCIEHGDSETCESNFTMAFFVPEEHQESPPEPADETIFVKNRPEMRVLTRKFGGFSNDAVIKRESKDLAEILQAAGEKGVDYNRHYLAGYDPPYKLINRRNEIWFVKTVPQEEEEEKREGEGEEKKKKSEKTDGTEEESVKNDN